jgi:hypothetical protein
MPEPRSYLHLTHMLLDRLERISADSVWAHRASGLRGSLLRELDQLQAGKEPDPVSLRDLIGTALHILRQAATHRG